MTGYVLPSQDIRKLIRDGIITNSSFKTEGKWEEVEDPKTKEIHNKLIYDNADDTALEDRIQTNSFEPRIEGHGFWIHNDYAQGLGTQSGSIAKNIDSLDGTLTREIDFKRDPELRVGSTYLIPLKEGIVPSSDMQLYANPKSSSGRTFADVQLLADGCSNAECLQFKEESYGRPTKLWLKVTPQIFNLELPKNENGSMMDHSFNQIRYFHGHGARVSAPDVLTKHSEMKDGILCHITPEKEKIKISDKEMVYQLTENGLKVNLSLRSVSGNYNLDHLQISPGEYWIMFSKHFLHIPEEWNAEMIATSNFYFHGKTHFAGFFDNRFWGQCVAEVRTDEHNITHLRHNAQFCAFTFNRTREIPDKLYGQGSNYFGQTGPNVAKNFNSDKIDFDNIVAFKARSVPDAIDLARRDLDVHKFFELFYNK